MARSSVSALMMMPSSPDQSIEALVPRKSKRWDSSLAAWFSALSASWRSILLTTSNDGSAMTLVSSLCVGPRLARSVRTGGSGPAG